MLKTGGSRAEGPGGTNRLRGGVGCGPPVPPGVRARKPEPGSSRTQACPSCPTAPRCRRWNVARRRAGRRRRRSLRRAPRRGRSRLSVDARHRAVIPSHAMPSGPMNMLRAADDLAASRATYWRQPRPADQRREPAGRCRGGRRAAGTRPTRRRSRRSTRSTAKRRGRRERRRAASGASPRTIRS